MWLNGNGVALQWSFLQLDQDINTYKLLMVTPFKLLIITFLWNKGCFKALKSRIGELKEMQPGKRRKDTLNLRGKGIHIANNRQSFEIH